MGISFRVSDSQLANVARNQRGQALVEYMLILIVTVALIIGFMFQFSSAFKVWANNYFGDYLTCLLETGELPTIGGANPGDSGICNQFFEEFSLRNGRPPKVSSSSSGRSGNRRAAGSSPATRGGRAIRDSSPSRRPVRSGGSSSGFLSSKSGSGRSGSGPGDGGDSAGLKSSGGTGNTEFVRGRSSGRSYRSGGRQIIGRLGGFKKESERAKGYFPGTKRSEEYSARSPKRVKIKPERKIAQTADNSQPMTFGHFIRILVIAAIVIALVMLILGQVLQITKSMDGE